MGKFHVLEPLIFEEGNTAQVICMGLLCNEYWLLGEGLFARLYVIAAA